MIDTLCVFTRYKLKFQIVLGEPEEAQQKDIG
jgi:hypothetical protein